MRKTVHATFILVILLIAVYVTPLPVSADALNITKVVSVVFDDSGSMNEGDRKDWAYANYAMQAFAGLMNKEDRLYITYMTDPATSVGLDLTGDIQDPVDAIRGHSGSGNTPEQAIDTAFSKLQSVPETDPNIQYWLVIITDGAFQDSSMENMPKAALDSKLSGFTDQAMPNGTGAQIIYLAIGDGAIKPEEDTGKGIYVYPQAKASGDDAVVNDSQIVGVMSEVADKVSGRTRVTEADMTIVDGKTIKITPQIPLLNIAVLSQKTEADITAVRSADGTLKRVQSANLLYPDDGAHTTDTSLKGKTFLFNNGDINIPADTYTFTFSESVSTDNIVFMYEPAIEIRLKLYYQNGNEITDYGSLRADETVDAESKIYEIGTNKAIDPTLLNSSVAYNVSHFEDGRLVSECNDQAMRIEDVALKEVETRFASTLTIEGFQPLVVEIVFHPQSPVEYTMEAAGPVDNTLSRTEAYNNEKGILFTVYVNGVQLTKPEVEKLDIDFGLDPPFKERMSLESTVNSDGTILSVPKYECWIFPRSKAFNWISTWPGVGMPTGELNVIGGINGKPLASDSLIVESGAWLWTLLNFFLPLLFLFAVFGWVFKRRFKRGSCVYYIAASRRGGAYMSQNANWTRKKLNSTNWNLVPWAPNRKRVGGVTFYARPGGIVGVKPGKVGKESRKLPGRNISETKLVNIPTHTLRRPFVPKDKTELRNMKFEEFNFGEVLFEAKDTQLCTLFKFIGGK